MTVVTNPLLPGCHPDPSICRVGDDYYLVVSTFEYLPGLPILRSRDLVTWEHVGAVVTDQIDYAGVPSSGGLYAPTIRHHDGTFYVVCTFVDPTDDARGGNFLVTATDPAGPWSAPVWLDVAGIDPSILFTSDGRAWMHGTRLVEHEPDWFHQTEVWVREYSLTEQRLVGDEHVVWNGAVRGAVWAEAPHLYEIDGTFYLVAAEGGTEYHHAVSVARAQHVTGPYEGNKANPVLTHRHLGHDVDVVGIGHADLVEAADGSWWAVCLGMRPYGGYHYNLGRETFLLPVVWEDGWPVLAPGVGRVPREVEVPFADAPGPDAGALARGELGGVVPPGDPRWTGVRALPDSLATPRGDGWDLPVRPATLEDVDAPAFLGVRQQHVDVDVVATVVADLPAGEVVGVAVRQSEHDHVRLELGRDADGAASDDVWTATVVHVRGGERTELGRRAVPVTAGDEVRLVVSARGQDYALGIDTGSGDVLEVAVADGRTLDTVATGGFLGLWIGVWASSGGTATTSTAHVVSVTYDGA
ncbi:family 43 glycosylhydrolase [Flavimobilis sp. GY10621]|uniref:Family 43 glycosylhydrolase n=1 Tax=Flavimobilis rhizosphaerae TaxID=2775421 RepID=A0ABR9DPV5_9MICO|nr:glycoside hydrolase family 43 protein [Flavimobilis rhizosphaerae]MBD9699157.1 family 43 glycosylhydrolase [Flavimobilis rhizosphaerae]